MEDRGGVAARISRILETPAWRQRRLPRVSFVETREDGPAGTLTAARTMAEAGVRALIVLGGDGTHRLVAQVCGDIPMTALSTGTNNVFPSICEATTAGIATGLVATGRLSRAAATMKNKILRVQVNGIQELALVDVCVSRAAVDRRPRALAPPGTGPALRDLCRSRLDRSVGGCGLASSRVSTGGIWSQARSGPSPGSRYDGNSSHRTGTHQAGRCGSHPRVAAGRKACDPYPARSDRCRW